MHTILQNVHQITFFNIIFLRIWTKCRYFALRKLIVNNLINLNYV